MIGTAIDWLGELARRRELHPVLRGRVTAMAAFLRFYVAGELELNWTEASELAAKGAGRGSCLARSLRRWTLVYITSGGDKLPTIGCHNVHRALVADEDVVLELKLHLQSIGQYFKALDIVDYTARDDVKERWGLPKAISERSAQRWLHLMSYRYGPAKKGLYADGHERPNVVHYRQDVFLPAWSGLQRQMVVWDNDGKVARHPEPHLDRVVWITHDESTFYANDVRKNCWRDTTQGPVPQPKGDGTSIMVSGFCSPDLGWLRSKDGEREALVIFKAGKNRDGYFTADHILATTRDAIDIFETHFPPGCGTVALFTFDNATTHQARAPDALSARKTPKFPKKWTPAPGVRMRDGRLPNGSPQSLYYPDDHRDPKKAGCFKGMKAILQERGLWPASGPSGKELRAECHNFQCADPENAINCCARRLLFSQPDFMNQKGILQEYVESRGHKFLFYPKFHCEFNFIEMVWGRGKYGYRMYGIPKNEAETEEHIRRALDSVSELSMKRFANRAARFMDAYEKGLSAKQVAWASKKYRGHRTLPPELVAEIRKSVP